MNDAQETTGVVASHCETAPVMQLKGITRSYQTPTGPLAVLQGVDLDVASGELLVIRGQSGIGKSTLLHIMGLLDRSDAGSIGFKGQDVTRASRRVQARLRSHEIAFVFQFFHLLPEFTALENVLMPGQIRHGFWQWRQEKEKANSWACEILDMVGVGKRAGHRPNQLSGGERQRVALARALFNRPSLLLCDEPTGNLDARTSEEIHRLLAEINRSSGQAMVVVTHDETLAAIADRVICLEGGIVVEG